MSHDDKVDEHILNIVQTQHIAEQIDLQNNLKSRGYDIPQATLSRRLKKLKIAKVGGLYQMIDVPAYHLPWVLNLQVSENGLIVLHTQPSQASSLALFIDKKYVNFYAGKTENAPSGVLGTIAGDDTVLLIVQDKAAIESVLKLLSDDFPYLTIHSH